MRAQTILWLLLRSRKTDLLLVVGEPRDYHAGETGSREGSWMRRRLYTFQLFDHTGATSISMTGYCSFKEARSIAVWISSRPNTHTILFRSMMIWQKCCSTGNSRAASNGMRIGFSQIPPRRSLTGRKKSRRSTSNPLQKRLAWAPESVGIHSGTHIGLSSMKQERR